jgi:uncharacterized protein (DUF302 family)
MPVDQTAGFTSKHSQYSVAETMERFQSLLKSKGITLFALIDHGGEAEKVGLKLPPTKLLIFGSPKGGTPLMQAAPSIAIDLPLKALVWEDAGGKVWLSYNDPVYLQNRHHVPDELLKNIAVIKTLVDEAAG